MSIDPESRETAPQRASQAQQGDRNAFEWLVRRYRNLVASIAYSHVGDFAKSEDIAQQTFLTAWQRLGTLQDTSTVSSWLAGIARNLARNEARKSYRRSECQTGDGQDSDLEYEERSTSNPETIAMRNEQHELLWHMLEKLPVNYREPLVLFYREGHSVQEVAEQLDLKPDTVKQRLSRGRNMLRTELMDVMEETLRETEPDEAFVGNVMAALPVTGILAAGGSATITKGIQFAFLKKIFGGTIMTGALGGILGGLLGTLGGLFGAWWGTKQSLDAATSTQERNAIKRMAVVVTGMALALTAAFTLISFYGDREYLPWFICVTCATYAVALTVVIMRYNHRIRQIKAEFGTEEEQKTQGYVYQQVHRPLSTSAQRLHLVGGLAGTSIWIFILGFLSQDYAAMAVLAVVIGGILVWAWAKVATLTKASEQLKFSSIAMMLLVLVEAIVVGVRWEQWPNLSFGSGLSFEGWLLAAAVTCIGMIIFAAGWSRARRVAEEELDSERVLET